MLGMGSEFGRIDEDGNVFVKTVDGERQIGSWQAGDAEAGLRSTSAATRTWPPRWTCWRSASPSGSGDPAAHARPMRWRLKDQLPAAAVIGDLAALDARLDAVLAAADERAGAARAAREQARADAIAAKEALVAEAEQIAESRHLVEGVRRPAARDRRGVAPDQGRRPARPTTRSGSGSRRPGTRSAGAAVSTSPSSTPSAAPSGSPRSALVARAEELSRSSEWRETAAAMRELMTEWKAVARAGPRYRGRSSGRASVPRRTPSSAAARRSSPSATRSRSTTSAGRKRSSSGPRGST